MEEQQQPQHQHDQQGEAGRDGDDEILRHGPRRRPRKTFVAETQRKMQTLNFV